MSEKPVSGTHLIVPDFDSYTRCFAYYQESNCQDFEIYITTETVLKIDNTSFLNFYQLNLNNYEVLPYMCKYSHVTFTIEKTVIVMKAANGTIYSIFQFIITLN